MTAGVIICKKDDAYFQAVCLPNIEIIEVMVEIFHQKITSKSYHQSIFFKPIFASLTPSKLAVLKGLAEGKNLKTIAGELQLNQKYVGNIASKLPKQLGCKNRDQLMYVTGMLDLAEVMKD